MLISQKENLMIISIDDTSVYGKFPHPLIVF